jgi:ribose transport system substrate-binding protein
VGLAALTKSKTYDHKILLTPQVWDNTTPDGVSLLQKTYDSGLDPYYSVAFDVKPYTTYTKADLVACQGP